MALEKSVDDFGVEQFAALGGAVAERIRQQSTERPADPVVRGNIETDFLALQDGRRELVFHQFLEKHFLLRTADLQRGGEFGGKLDKAMIEKRRTHFDGVSHAHTVALRENVRSEALSVAYRGSSERRGVWRQTRQGDDREKADALRRSEPCSYGRSS